MCPLEKTIGMMRAIVTYYEGARKAIVESSSETKINWNDIHFQTKPLFTELTQMKFMTPKQSKKEFSQYFSKYVEDVNAAFRKITDR